MLFHVYDDDDDDGYAGAYDVGDAYSELSLVICLMTMMMMTTSGRMSFEVDLNY